MNVAQLFGCLEISVDIDSLVEGGIGPNNLANLDARCVVGDSLAGHVSLFRVHRGVRGRV